MQYAWEVNIRVAHAPTGDDRVFCLSRPQVVTESIFGLMKRRCEERYRWFKRHTERFIKMTRPSTLGVTLVEV